MEFNGVTHYAPPVVDGVYEEDRQLYAEEDDGYSLTEQYGEGEYSKTQTILADGGSQFGVSTVAFDQEEELLWMGNQGGHVTAYYGGDLQKYTSFQVHSTQEVRDILTFPEGILALTQSSLRCQMRRGIPIYTHSSPNLVEMQCLLQMPGTSVLLAGHQANMVNFDYNTSQEVQLVEVGQSGCAILRRHARFVCAGEPAGNIKLLDPATLHIEHHLDTHSGSLSDFDIHGNLLVTCGFSARQGVLSCDRFLMVYDLRMLRCISPIPVVIDPLLMRFLPSFSSRLAVVSVVGQMQLVDTLALSEQNLCLYQMNTGSSPMSLAVSPSCQFLAIGDGGGHVHLFASSTANARFNSFSRDTEFADPVDPLPHISMDDMETSLNASLYEHVKLSDLASDWPPELLKKAYRSTPAIEPEMLKSMKLQGTIGYAPNPMTARRNQVPYLSDKKRLQVSKGKGYSNGDSNAVVGGGAIGGDTDASPFIAIPKRYRRIELKHTKEDVEWDQFNKTKLCGIEAPLNNNYCNTLLQMLYMLDSVRSLALSHLCNKEFCLCCELSFLFAMMDTSRTTPCQANNFLRAFRTVPEASALGLILNDTVAEARRRAPLKRLIQNWNRFIVHHLHLENTVSRRRSPRTEGEWHRAGRRSGQSPVHEYPPNDRSRREDEGDGEEAENEGEAETDVSRLFGMKQLQINRCLKCVTDVSKRSTLLVSNLHYITHGAAHGGKIPERTFCSVLKHSLCPEQTTPAWCEKCDKFQPTLQVKHIESLPHILTLNCGMDSQQDKDFWQTQMANLTATKVTPGDNKTGDTGVIAGSTKQCRYGEHCNRGNCRFRHPGQDTDKTDTRTGWNNTWRQLQYTEPWLPTHIQIDLSHKGTLDVTKLSSGDLDKEHKMGDSKDSVQYELVGVICHITEADDRENLVAFIKVPPHYLTRAGSPGHTAQAHRSTWHLFNNFSITPVPEQEVTWFSLDWKVPCVLYWANRHLPQHFCPRIINNPITADVFGEDKSIARAVPGRKRITFTPLAPDEMPKKGELVAMDAEFVTLNQEESELRSDGKLSTVKPSHMSVARITCVRGQGVLAGTPFIDDYISTQEQVFDYVTKFSGIQPGDLDANFSSKHLTTLKSTYLKLRFLIDNGVIFVGHGLKNDFRVINLVVPTEQVIDTVHLFHLPHQRMISLRFLAWHFLGIKIQSDTHDSIEDARTALQLYHHYVKLEDDGFLESALEKLYKTGKTVQWKVSSEDDVVWPE